MRWDYIRKGMDQNLGKIPGASNINELQKITLLETAHILRKLEKVSDHQIKNPPGAGMAPVLGECRKQLIALKTFIITIIVIKVN